MKLFTCSSPPSSGIGGVFLLRTVIIIDYQNIHLTSAQLFAESIPIHRSLIDPLRFSQELISARNDLQKLNYPLAKLSKILVYRGLPSVKHDPKNYGRNLAQKANWERNSLVNVTYRPLKYPLVRDSKGKYLVGKPEEKGTETCAWHVSGNPSSREIRPEGTAIWNTRLNHDHFINSLDKNIYS